MLILSFLRFCRVCYFTQANVEKTYHRYAFKTQSSFPVVESNYRTSTLRYLYFTYMHFHFMLLQTGDPQPFRGKYCDCYFFFFTSIVTIYFEDIVLKTCY